MTTRNTMARSASAPKKIFISITDHGFGHLAQLAPWLNHPNTVNAFEVTLHSSLPPSTVQKLVTTPHHQYCCPTDPGMAMRDALRVDPQGSYRQYIARFKNQTHHLEKTLKRIKETQPDLVLSNVGWTALQAAQKCHIPNFATSSLNWSDLFFHYCGHYPLGKHISDTIHDVYANTQGFIKLTPGMAMHNLKGPKLGFIARAGKKQKLSPKAGSAANAKIKWVLVSTGGLPLDLSPSNWPNSPNIQWIFTRQKTPKHRTDMHTPETLGQNFIDVLASVDAVITKPGYVMFTEAALHGRPVLYIQRPDWPEQDSLIQWLNTKVICASINWQEFQKSHWLTKLNRLLDTPIEHDIQADRTAEAEKTIHQFTEILKQACS